jgi:hypothetical protein
MNLIHSRHSQPWALETGVRTKLQVLKKVIEESSHVVHLILFLRTSLAVVACSRSGPVLAAYTITRCGDTFRNLKEVVICYGPWTHGLRGRVGAVQLLEAAKKRNPGYVQRCMTDPRHL